MVSLTRHILEQQQLQADGAEDLSAIMNGIVSGGKKIARELSVAGLTDSLGTTSKRNVHGEQVQRMDARANELFVEVFQDSAIVQIVVSEEMDEPFVVGQAEKARPEPVEGSGKICRIFRSAGRFLECRRQRTSRVDIFHSSNGPRRKFSEAGV